MRAEGEARRRGADDHTRRRTFVAVAIVAVCAAAALATVLTARLVFPNGSGDLDEVSYQAQANTLAAGHLTLPTATDDPAFVPFLSGVRDDRIVFKYQPVWPALIATSDATTGSTLPLRVLLSIAGALATAVTPEDQTGLLDVQLRAG